MKGIFVGVIGVGNNGFTSSFLVFVEKEGGGRGKNRKGREMRRPKIHRIRTTTTKKNNKHQKKKNILPLLFPQTKAFSTYKTKDSHNKNKDSLYSPSQNTFHHYDTFRKEAFVHRYLVVLSVKKEKEEKEEKEKEKKKEKSQITAKTPLLQPPTPPPSFSSLSLRNLP